jgi:ABC-type xylose transport system permease subunit
VTTSPPSAILGTHYQWSDSAVAVDNSLRSVHLADTLTARLSAPATDLGTNHEPVTIASVIIDGSSLRGGPESVTGAMLLDAFLLAAIDNGLPLLGTSSYTQDEVNSVISAPAERIDQSMTKQQMSS